MCEQMGEQLLFYIYRCIVRKKCNINQMYWQEEQQRV